MAHHMTPDWSFDASSPPQGGNSPDSAVPATTIDPTATIHETAWVDAPCGIGPRTGVWHFSHIMAHALIGSDCHIAQHVTIYSGVMLNSRVRVMENARLNSGVIMEEGTTCGPSVSVCGLNQLRGSSTRLSKISPTLIRTHATLGPNASVAAGITVGQHAFVEANTVVDTNVPDFAIVSGNPLKIIGFRCRCGVPLPIKPNASRLPEAVACEQCGEDFQRGPAKHQWQPVKVSPIQLLHPTGTEF